VTFDVTKARRETPGCERVMHLNNAGASLVPTPVLDEVIRFWRQEAEYGAYEAAARDPEAVQRPYRALARLLGCEPDEIALTDNATRAWGTVFLSLAFKPGDRILISQAEYGNNLLALLRAARTQGVKIQAIPNDPVGQVSVEALRQMLDERVKLVAITHIPTHGGLVNPAAEIGAVTRAAGAPYLLDACQSVGQMPVDVHAIGCDFLTATSRKYLRGPRGVGFIYARRDWLPRLDPPIVDWAEMRTVSMAGYEPVETARRLEVGEANQAARAGLGVAVEYALEWGLEAIWQRVTGLAELLRQRLLEIPGVSIHDTGASRCGIVTFTMAERDPEALRAYLAEQDINIKVSRRESAFLEMDARGLKSLARASVHYYNTEDELDRFCRALQEMPSPR
jgi:cysteine desulfurase/selenocysteine lyase